MAYPTHIEPGVRLVIYDLDIGGVEHWRGDASGEPVLTHEEAEAREGVDQ